MPEKKEINQSLVARAKRIFLLSRRSNDARLTFNFIIILFLIHPILYPIHFDA